MRSKTTAIGIQWAAPWSIATTTPKWLSGSWVAQRLDITVPGWDRNAGAIWQRMDQSSIQNERRRNQQRFHGVPQSTQSNNNKKVKEQE